MGLAFYHRPKNYYTLVVNFTRDKNENEIEEQEKANLDESSIIDMSHTEVVIIKGSHFDEVVRLEKMMPEGEKNTCYLCTSGMFMLYEKYFTLNQLKFTDPNGEKAKDGP